MHPHEELALMELLLQYPDQTIADVLHKVQVYEETGSQYACCTLQYYLRKKTKILFKHFHTTVFFEN